MTRFDVLWEEAASQAGYFTLGQARGAGYSAPLVEHHVQAGRFQRAGRGIFRVVHYPPSDHEDLVVAWLWSGRTGVVSHETALALHGLSDALPARIHLTVPAAWRRRRLRVPPGVVLHYHDLAPDERTWHGAVPVTSPMRTVLDCARDGVRSDLVHQAVTQGARRGLFQRRELERALRLVFRARPQAGPEVSAALGALLKLAGPEAPRGGEPGDAQVRSWLAEAGAPLLAEPAEEPSPTLEVVLAEGLVLARRDATVARVMPLLLWRRRDDVDVDRLTAEATRRDERQTLGFFLDLAGQLGRSPALKAAARRLRDGRRRRVEPFFRGGPGGPLALAAARRTTPAVARRWGFVMNVGLDSFASLFEKHAGGRP